MADAPVPEDAAPPSPPPPQPAPAASAPAEAESSTPVASEPTPAAEPAPQTRASATLAKVDDAFKADFDDIPLNSPAVVHQPATVAPPAETAAPAALKQEEFKAEFKEIPIATPPPSRPVEPSNASPAPAPAAATSPKNEEVQADFPERDVAGIQEPAPPADGALISPKKINLAARSSLGTVDARPTSVVTAAIPTGPAPSPPKTPAFGSLGHLPVVAGQALLGYDDVSWLQNHASSDDDPAAIVRCTGKDVKCTWTGRRDLLAAHTSVCPHEALRPLLTDLLTRISELETHDKISVPALRGCFVDKDTKLITTIARCFYIECNREFCYSWFPTAESPAGTYTPNECPHCSKASLPPERLVKAVAIAQNPATTGKFFAETKPIQGLGLKPDIRGCVIIPEGRLAAALHQCEGCHKDFYIMYSFVQRIYTPSGCIFCKKRTLPDQRLVMATQLPL